MGRGSFSRKIWKCQITSKELYVALQNLQNFTILFHLTNLYELMKYHLVNSDKAIVSRMLHELETSGQLIPEAVETSK